MQILFFDQQGNTWTAQHPCVPRVGEMVLLPVGCRLVKTVLHDVLYGVVKIELEDT